MGMDADWYSDPGGAFEHRYWDGNAWTNHVSNDGAQSEDTLDQAALVAFDAPAAPYGDASKRRQPRWRLIETMTRNTKYRKPMREGTFAATSFAGGDWNEYADVALTAMVLETLLDIDQWLMRLLDYELRTPLEPVCDRVVPSNTALRHRSPISKALE